MQDLNRNVNSIFDGRNACNTEQAVSIVIPKKFTNATLEKEKTDLKEKINDISQENATLIDSIKNAKKDIRYWEEEICNAEVCKKIEDSSFKDCVETWKDDQRDPRYIEIQEIHRKRMFEIPERINNANKERLQAEHKIPLLEKKISENANKRDALQAELLSIENDLRKKTPLQRMEEGYQRLLKEKVFIPLRPDFLKSDSESNAAIDKLIELTEQFGEMEGYKNTEALKKECLDLAIRIHYNNMVRLKNELDSSGRATYQDYTDLAREFRDAKGYADTEELAIQCDIALVEVQYRQLLQAKDIASGEEEYLNLARQFRAMNGYKNTAELANQCDNQYLLLKERNEEVYRIERMCIAEQKRKREEAERRRQKRLVAGRLAIGFLLGGLALWLFGCFIFLSKVPIVNALLTIYIPFTIVMIITAIILKRNAEETESYVNISLGSGFIYSIIAIIITLNKGIFESFSSSCGACFATSFAAYIIGGIFIFGETRK